MHLRRVLWQPPFGERMGVRWISSGKEAPACLGISVSACNAASFAFSSVAVQDGMSPARGCEGSVAWMARLCQRAVAAGACREMVRSGVSFWAGVVWGLPGRRDVRTV